MLSIEWCKATEQSEFIVLTVLWAMKWPPKPIRANGVNGSGYTTPQHRQVNGRNALRVCKGRLSKLVIRSSVTVDVACQLCLDKHRRDNLKQQLHD